MWVRTSLDAGRLFVFEPEKRAPGILGQMADKAQEVIPDFADILSMDAVEQYFRLHYWQQSARWDENDVMKCFCDPQGRQFQFRTGADRFHMIENASRSVFVPWSRAGEALEEELRSSEIVTRRLRRKAQRYLVPIYEQAFNAMVGSDIDIGSVEGIPILLNRDLYDEQLGLQLELAGQHDPGGLIA